MDNELRDKLKEAIYCWQCSSLSTEQLIDSINIVYQYYYYYYLKQSKELELTPEERNKCYYGDNPCEIPAWLIRVMDNVAQSQLDKAATWYEVRIQKLKDNDEQLCHRYGIALTTIKDSENLIDKMYEALCHADFSNGNVEFGVDEGRIRGNEFMTELFKEYDNFKKSINGGLNG